MHELERGADCVTADTVARLADRPKAKKAGGATCQWVPSRAAWLVDFPPVCPRSTYGAFGWN